jgi:2'-5' RNA ligase
MHDIKRDGEFSYSSTQVNFEGMDKHAILDFGKNFIDPTDLVEWGLETTVHCTIKYGIETNDVNPLREIAKMTKPISLVLGKTSIFSTNPDYDVVKIDVLSQDLRNLNKLIKDSVPCTDTFPVYMPHVTIGYCKSGSGQKYVGNTMFEGKQFTFNKFIFSPSEGEDVSLYFFDHNNGTPLLCGNPDSL